jgi:formylglycine-generating enzyme required for sulfatase activity
MHGNVSEWCEDFYHERYKNPPTNGAANKKPGNLMSRVSRGGMYGQSGSALRCANRNPNTPNTLWFGQGFRIVANPK